MMKIKKGESALILACLLMLPLVACEDSETIPPDGSTITVAANPTTVVLGTLPQCNSILQQNSCGTSQVIATVRSELGIPLPGQDVRFSTTAGQLYTGTLNNPIPASNIPIETDSLGNSTVGLIVATTATVTATSGTATGTLTLNTVTGNLSQIVLNIDDTPESLCSGSSTTDVTSCNQEICFKAEALDTMSMPLDGVTIIFTLQNNTTQGNTFSGTFNPAQAVTGGLGDPGIAHTRFMINSDCPQQCSVTQMGGPCTAQVLAATQGGFQSTPLQLLINIP